MKEKKPTVSHRMGDLKFPQDKHNVMYAVKKEMLKAIGRIRGNAEKEKTFRDTMALLMQYANVKIKHDTDLRAQAVANAIANSVDYTDEMEEEVVKTPEPSQDNLKRDLGLE